MTAGGGSSPFSGLTPCGVPRATSTAVARPSPSAVASPTRSEPIASLTNLRSRVGADVTCATVLKATTATRYFAGSSWRKRRAEACAAASRVGGRSGAPIEREVSMAMTAVASSERTERSAWGRAKPTRNPATASRRIAGGRCRRQPGTRSTTFGSSAGSTKAAASRSRRPWNQM